jgi:hypothetical protein
MFVGERHINAIEQELQERLMLELQGFFPPIFVGENGELDVIAGRPEPWRLYFNGRIPPAWEAAAVKIECENLIVERYRDRIAIARSLGPGATMDLYRAECAKEGVEP